MNRLSFVTTSSSSSLIIDKMKRSDNVIIINGKCMIRVNPRMLWEQTLELERNAYGRNKSDKSYS